MGSARSWRLTWTHGLLALGLAIAGLYVVRYHAGDSPLLMSLLMPSAALLLCLAAVAILVPITTGHPCVIHRPPSATPWRRHLASGLGLLWATFAAPALLPAGAPILLELSAVLVSIALLLAAAIQLAHAISPLLDPPSDSPTPSS